MNSPLLDLPPLPNGTEIASGHRIQHKLGQGSFGITYCVRSPTGDTTLALKEYAPRDMAFRGRDFQVRSRPHMEQAYAQGLDAFRREAEALRKHGGHPNIVRVRALFSKFNTAYILMDLISGEHLRSLIRNKQFPDHRQLFRFLRQIGSALTHLHNQELLHRDVKPENIMIDREGTPILIDFGAARQVVPSGHNTMIFTPQYAPIEQRDRRVTHDGKPMLEGPWTDIYALGVIAYELACGQPPANSLERASKVLAEQPDPYVPLVERAEEKFDQAFCNAVDRACKLFPANVPAPSSNGCEDLREDVVLTCGPAIPYGAMHQD